MILSKMATRSMQYMLLKFLLDHVFPAAAWHNNYLILNGSKLLEFLSSDAFSDISFKTMWMYSTWQNSLHLSFWCLYFGGN